MSNGGAEYVYSSGTASGTVLSNGGTEFVYSGGTAVGTVVSKGGIEVVYSGGIASGTALLAGGVIDVGSGLLDFASGGTAVWNSNTDILTVTEGGNTYTQQLSGDYTGDAFVLSSDGTGGTDITDNAICYLRGTRILSPTGQTAVEDIRAGDLVVTRFGSIQPVKWIGRQSYDWHFIQKNTAKIPVRIQAGALGPNMPARDLYVSPGHSMLVGETLVLASARW